MTCLLKNIKQISREKIIYLDNDGVSKEINLFDCSKNWVEHYNPDDYMGWEGKPAPKITFEKNKCVGERNWFADKPYYEFYSTPKIRFEINPQKRFFDCFRRDWRHKQKYHTEFHSITTELEKSGWITFDLG